MRSVKLSELTGSLSAYARQGLREPIVVTRKGRPVMAVMPLTKYDDWESVSLAVNPRFMEIIERSRASARAHGYHALGRDSPEARDSASTSAATKVTLGR